MTCSIKSITLVLKFRGRTDLAVLKHSFLLSMLLYSSRNSNTDINDVPQNRHLFKKSYIKLLYYMK